VRLAVLAACVLALLAEYRTSVALVPFTTEEPAIYRFLAKQPRGVVAEFPTPRVNGLPGADPEYAYLSTFHWFPMVNGYSGYYPSSYLDRIDRLRDFPSGRALNQLRRDTVQYVLLHSAPYSPTELNEIRARILRDGQLVELGSFDAADGPAFLYRLR
jgi:hypothetical protein